MADNFKTHVFVVDDDSCILDAISLNLKKARIGCTCFGDADDCLQSLHVQNCDLLVTDVRMPDKDGIELLTQARHIVPWLPAIVMTSYGDIPMAVKAVKAGAVGFVEKPLQWEDFLTLVQTTIEQDHLNDALRGKPLTKTEKNILHQILQGKSNRAIASTFNRSIRTIEVHRSHIMHKLDVDNVVDLVKRATVMGLGNSK